MYKLLHIPTNRYYKGGIYYNEQSFMNYAFSKDGKCYNRLNHLKSSIKYNNAYIKPKDYCIVTFGEIDRINL